MVVVKRKGTGFDALPLIQPSDSAQWHSPYAVSAEHRRSNSQPPRIGATFRGWKSPVVKMLSFESTTSSSSYYPSSHAGIKESNWLIKIVYAAAAVSWVALRIRSVDYFSMSAALEKDSFAINAQMQHMLVDIEIIEKIVSQEKQLLKNLNQTRTALEHEIRMIKEAEPSNAPKPYSKSEDTINDWLINRQNILLTKIKYLQRYVQASSRATVLDRFGPGPHRVKFTVDMVTESRKRSLKSFVVEMAPLDLMPVSIHLFLDMVTAGIWNNTIFLHDEEVEHVIAAAPVDHATQTIKHNHISNIGWVGLGFPEYSDQFPHAQYTIGFAGQGPTFYINTMDNSEQHGPGGQGHHLLPDDADPCFARVVEGFEVIDDLARLGLHQKETTRGSHPWADDGHTWTHIVSVNLHQKDGK